MLDFLSISSIDELYSDIPANILYRGKLDIPRFSEAALTSHMNEVLSRNIVFSPNKIYVGGGIWPLYIPSVVKNIVNRTEFLTAYTPYQAEFSQGLMQALYEYQSLMAELLDMDVVNSSMYDWASAAGEALLMASRVSKSNVVLVPSDIPMNRKMVIRTYLWGAGIRYIEYPLDEYGNIEIRFLRELDVEDGVAGIYVEYPNCYGYIPLNIDEVSSYIHNMGGILIMGIDPITLPMLKPPGKYDADVVVGEGQPLGNHMYFGGPLLGIFAVRGDMKLIREMPGRVMGLTRTFEGENAFTMILQAREQHIRREKATSNICTNEALTAIASAVYISILGAKGLVELSRGLLVNAHKLYDMMIDLGFEGSYELPFFREFSVMLDKPYNSKELISYLLENGYLFGYINGRYHTVSVNEHHSQDDFEEILGSIRGVVT
jgi:glycine dehydrogenase subunit 1